MNLPDHSCAEVLNYSRLSIIVVNMSDGPVKQVLISMTVNAGDPSAD